MHPKYKTGFLYDERYLLHRPGSFHPEIPDRLTAICSGIEAAGLTPYLVPIKARPAERRWIEAVHDPSLIDRLETACSEGQEIFECADNQMCQQTFDIAVLAVGGVIEAARMLMEGKIHNAFCAVRPPGHHAERARAMGFCYFNNVAIAAKYLQNEWDIDRIGIVDFDVHHGNGTQQIFEDDPSVFYYSIHEHPTFAYPGTGRETEQGKGKGFGYTKNSPVLPGKGDLEYTRLIERDLLPPIGAFGPEVLLVSAGFDAHSKDNLAGIRLSTQWFSWVMKQIMQIAHQHASDRVISVLEGGYALEHLPELAKNHVEILLGYPS